jgi:hypothetical protein
MNDPSSPNKSPDQRPIDPHRPMTFHELCQYLRARPPTIRTYLAEGLKEVGSKVGKEWHFLPLEVIERLKWRQRRRAAGQSKPGRAARALTPSAKPRIERFLNQHWPQ